MQRACVSLLSGVTLGVLVPVLAGAQLSPPSGAPVTLACPADNDLYAALRRAGRSWPRYDSAEAAIAAAPAGGTVMILADGYPERATQVADDLLERAAGKQLRLYIEYPARLPGIELGEPRQAVWERMVVASDAFAPQLPKLRILAPHGCRFVPVQASDPQLVLGRVAGYDRAVFGLPEPAFPMLFDLPGRRVTVAATALSRFVTGRYGPAADWIALWNRILATLVPGEAHSLDFVPALRPALSRDEPLPTDVERHTFKAAVRWLIDGKLLIHPAQEAEIHRLLLDSVWTIPAPAADTPIGDGSCGILEGYESAIQPDGSQRRRTVIRNDCNTESAMCFAFDWALHKEARSGEVAANLLDYTFVTARARHGQRSRPTHPAFGFIAWGEVAPAWLVATYGDDNARAILATLAAAACLDNDRWDEPVLQALLANLRTTGPQGFRGDRIDVPQLEQHGWRHFHDTPRVNPSPHFESALWACYLWAYARTGHREFFDKARSAIALTMEAYPDRWLWRNNLERARMILPLAWLVRIEDTPEHRGWLRSMIDDLLAHQDSSGAIAIILGTSGSGHFLAPTSNAEYGTREVPLIQENGDPASDQLYETGFALWSLREAFTATRDPRIKEAEDRLTDYLCRIQIRSPRWPYLNGGWFRAFDFRRWEFWASSGDEGWGAWCLEAGWGHAWITAALAMRLMDTDFWDLTADTRIARHMARVQDDMAINTGGPWTAPGD
ncbi:MAG: hypothetical protein GXY55_15260 [Phycisphaerae bacterium]|nr:hypothetical protein [Phycisphaerae bacterium]